MTSAKEEVVAESRSDGQKIAFELGKIAVEMNTESEVRPRDKLVKVVLAVEDVRLFVAQQRKLVPDDPRVEKALTLRSMLLRTGMREPAIAPGGRRKRYKVNLGSAGGRRTFASPTSWPTSRSPPTHPGRNLSPTSRERKWTSGQCENRAPSEGREAVSNLYP